MDPALVERVSSDLIKSVISPVVVSASSMAKRAMRHPRRLQKLMKKSSNHRPSLPLHPRRCLTDLPWTIRSSCTSAPLPHPAPKIPWTASSLQLLRSRVDLTKPASCDLECPSITRVLMLVHTMPPLRSMTFLVRFPPPSLVFFFFF